jgi:uncharacterized membrane protein
MDSEHSNKLPGAFSLFGPSWQAFKVNWVILVFGVLVPIVALLLVVAFLQLVVHFVFSGVSATDGGFSLWSTTVSTVNIVSVIIGAGAILFAIPLASALYYYTKLASASGVKLRYWPSVRRSLHFFWRILGLTLLRFILVFCGLILLVVPGLIVLRRYMLAPYYLIDEDLGVFEAMRRSLKGSKTFSGALWGLIGVYVVVAVASILLNIIPIVGWLFSIVLSLVTLCLAAVRYVQVREVAKAS